MLRRIAVALVLTVVAIPAHAGFNEVLAGLEAHLGRRTWIPLLGVIRVGVRVIHPDGVHDLQLAVFEGKGHVDSEFADQLMRTRIGKDYAPLVRVRERNDREWTYIYAKAVGERLIDLVVLAKDGSDTTLVRVVCDPEVVARYLDDNPRNVALVAHR